MPRSNSSKNLSFNCTKQSIEILKVQKQTHNQNKSSQTCKWNNKADHACIDSICQKHVLICKNQHCPCRQQHKFCAQIFIQGIKHKISQKIIPLKQTKKLISTQIQKLNKKLIDFNELILQKFSTGLQNFGMPNKQKHFLECLSKGTLQNYTGKQIKKLTETNIQDMTKPQKIRKQFEDKCLRLFQFLNGIITQSANSIIELIDDLKCISAPLYQGVFTKQSNIVKQNLDQKQIHNFFNNQTIVTANLLYKASSSNFKAQQFHKNCDQIPDTLTICETQNGKLIGGYTPLVWSKSNTRKLDKSGKSFIFSLTDNKKFQLQKQKIAISQCSTRGPVFGITESPDFDIDDRANLNENSWSKIGQSYKNKNYEMDKQQSWQKFNGSLNKSYLYKVKQWQVWQLIFINKTI